MTSSVTSNLAALRFSSKTGTSRQQPQQQAIVMQLVTGLAVACALAAAAAAALAAAADAAALFAALAATAGGEPCRMCTFQDTLCVTGFSLLLEQRVRMSELL